MLSKQLKFVLKTIGISLAVISVLLVAYLCIVFNNLSKRGENYRNYCPSSLENTKWVCQEKNIYFITYERGIKSTGMAEIDGQKKPFEIFFSPRAMGFGIVSGESGSAERACEFDGGAVFAEGICTLIYDAENDRNSFWSEESGEVTLTFIKEDLP